MNLMRNYILLADRIAFICGALSACLLAISIFLVCQMVFIRYVLVGSTAWQTDVIIFCLVGATLLGSAYVHKQRGHCAVELLIENAPDMTRRKLLLSSDFVVLVFSLILFWKGLELVHQAYVGGWETETIDEIPLWIPYLALPIGFGAMILQTLAAMMRQFLPPDDPAQLEPAARKH